MLGYYALRLMLLPGIVLHELSHYYFCRLVGAEIHEVCFFSFGYPAGYVIHTAPKRFRAHCVIALGPLLINSVAAVALFVAAIGTWHELAALDPVDWPPGVLRLAAAGWLGLVAAVAYPVALAIQLTNWLRLVWVDWLYAGLLIWVALRLTS